MAKQEGHVIVVDPAMKTAEIESFNQIVHFSGGSCTYHLPCLMGPGSLDAEDLERVKGVIVMGSAASVNDSYPWQDRLRQWLGDVFKHDIPTLGICYGHQLISNMFGGTVEFVDAERKKKLGFRKVNLETDSIFRKHSGELVVSHNEHVSRVPDCMRIIGQSDEIRVDALAHVEKPIFTFQPHPEASLTFVQSRNPGVQIDRSRLRYGHSLVQDFLNFALEK